MKTLFKVALVVYIIVMLGCMVSFFIQQFIIYEQHIKSGREQAKLPQVVQIYGNNNELPHEQRIKFLNNSIMANPLGMGNEIEEQLLSLLVANLATGILLVLFVLTKSRTEQPQRTTGQSL